jgi:hypothetical protein
VSDIKISGNDDLAKLLHKVKTWDIPTDIKDFFTFAQMVIETSRYTDLYKETPAEDLAAVIRVKARRAMRAGHIDLEELVDIAAYSALLFTKMRELQKLEGI